MQFLRTTNQACAEIGVEIDSEPWEEIRHGLYTLALTKFPAIRVLYKNPTVRPFTNRQNDNWAPMLALAQFFENCGAAGLVNTIIHYAKGTISVVDDITLPAYDVAVLRVLEQHSHLENEFTLSPQRLLEMVCKETGQPWRRESPESTGHMLRRLGFRRGDRDRRGSTYRFTREQVVNVAKRYNIPLEAIDTVTTVTTVTTATTVTPR